jgi:hypothetical protein
MQCTFTYPAVIYRTMRIVLILVYHTTRATLCAMRFVYDGYYN